MTTIHAADAQERLPDLIGQTAQSHEPIHILSDTHPAVLIAEQDWRAIQKTLHLVSIPGMRESIREGMATPLDECSPDPGW